jgi:OOP family OmpA-OmpF porin
MKKLLAVIIVSLASSTAMAQDKGWYVGGALGQSKAKEFCDGLSGGGFFGGNTTCDDTDTTVKAMGGYQFTKNFALELGLMNAGTVEARGPTGRVTVETGIFEGTALAILPLGAQFSVFGKFGLYSSVVDTTISTVLINRMERKTNSDLTFGAGVGWVFTPKFQLRAEWQRYKDVDAGDLGKSDADVISLGLLYRFF